MNIRYALLASLAATALACGGSKSSDARVGHINARVTADTATITLTGLPGAISLDLCATIRATLKDAATNVTYDGPLSFSSCGPGRQLGGFAGAAYVLYEISNITFNQDSDTWKSLSADIQAELLAPTTQITAPSPNPMRVDTTIVAGFDTNAPARASVNIFYRGKEVGGSNVAFRVFGTAYQVDQKAVGIQCESVLAAGKDFYAQPDGSLKTIFQVSGGYTNTAGEFKAILGSSVSDFFNVAIEERLINNVKTGLKYNFLDFSATAKAIPTDLSIDTELEYAQSVLSLPARDRAQKIWDKSSYEDEMVARTDVAASNTAVMFATDALKSITGAGFKRTNHECSSSRGLRLSTVRALVGKNRLLRNPADLIPIYDNFINSVTIDLSTDINGTTALIETGVMGPFGDEVTINQRKSFTTPVVRRDAIMMPAGYSKFSMCQGMRGQYASTVIGYSADDQAGLFRLYQDPTGAWQYFQTVTEKSSALETQNGITGCYGGQVLAEGDMSELLQLHQVSDRYMLNAGKN